MESLGASSEKPLRQDMWADTQVSSIALLDVNCPLSQSRCSKTHLALLPKGVPILGRRETPDGTRGKGGMDSQVT